MFAQVRLLLLFVRMALQVSADVLRAGAVAERDHQLRVQNALRGHQKLRAALVDPKRGDAVVPVERAVDRHPPRVDRHLVLARPARDERRQRAGGDEYDEGEEEVAEEYRQRRAADRDEPQAPIPIGRALAVFVRLDVPGDALIFHALSIA